MAELKCPWQTVKTTEFAEDGNRTEREVFADCLKSGCPFWIKGKYMSPVCYRAMREVGRD